jgi:23S rRNA-/tRNA-specific pseudouridylate synthase
MKIPAPRLIAETQRWLVVDKPPGWLSIPRSSPGAPGDPETPCIRDWLRESRGSAFVVHRLDRETSGVLLFARNEESQREAGIAFQSRKVRKTYDLLASGSPRAPVLKLDAPIRGAHAATQVECVRRYGAHAFQGRARPVTGRRHQIRIHLSGAGHPILGDVEHGGARELALPSGAALRVERVALHASRLELPGGEVFESAWPEDFAGWARALEEGTVI